MNEITFDELTDYASDEDRLNLLRGFLFKCIYEEEIKFGIYCFMPDDRTGFEIITPENNRSFLIAKDEIGEYLDLFKKDFPNVFRIIELEKYCELLNSKVPPFSLGLFINGLRLKHENQSRTGHYDHYYISETNEKFFHVIVKDIHFYLSEDEIWFVLNRIFTANSIK